MSSRNPRLDIIKGRYTLSGKVKDRDLPHLFETIKLQQDALDAVRNVQDWVRGNGGMDAEDVQDMLSEALDKAEVKP